MRCLHLSKAVIRNFRSIESLHLNNIGDITVLIGANESGKSNILLALKWFGNDEPLSEDDLPVDKDIKKDEVIIELYLKITDVSQFRNLLESKINEEFENLLGIDSIAELNDLEIFYSFLKFQKHADGSFTCFIFDDRLKEVTRIIAQYLQNKIKNADLSAIFRNVFEKRLASLLSAKNIRKTQIPNGVNIVKNNPNFSNPLNSITEKLSSFKPNNVKKPFSHLDTELQSIIIRIPNNTYTFNISGKSIQLNPHSLFAEVWNQIKSFDFEELLQRSLKRMKPNFVYLAEEMELKGSVKKEDTWSKTLREDNEKYVINSRLFSILGIDLDKFDKMDLERQSLELRNKLNVFSNKLSELWWKQQKLRIVPNIAPQEIILHIEEVDENNNPIKTTSPEMRSRGFKWYLAYLITLEYLKNKENTILLLDDPAVFLHEKGQKDFLKRIEDVSENVQIFYNTHLISLFDERELDRVVLVKLDDKNRTTIEKPWTNKIEEVAAPVYHALGFDKLIFENVKKILFVEGISDKFIFEGLQKANENLKEWYIHPLSGGNKLEDSELIERIKLLACLSAHKEIEYRFVLDGDRRNVVEQKYSEIKDKIKDKVLFLGSESQEMEDLLNKDFYLDCVLECYQNIFMDNPDNLRKIEKIVEDIKRNEVKSKITKKIEEKFREHGLRRFSKVDVAILIKRKLKRGRFKKENFSHLLKELEKL